MNKEENMQVTRRTTRASSSAPISPTKDVIEAKKTGALCSSTLDGLVCGERILLEDLLTSFPGRRTQILELIQLLGPLNSPMLPIFLYGGPSTGKTSITLQLFRHLNRPFVYVSFHTCYNPRILFESVLNQLLLHRKNSTNGYSSVKRCDKPSDFINYLRDALTSVLKGLKDNVEKSKSKKSTRLGSGNMIYLIFDNMELVRDWDKSSSMLPFLFSLYDLLNISELGLIFMSSTSPDTFYLNMGFIEPSPIYFPSYTEVDLRQILLRNQENQKLYSSFLDVALSALCRTTRRLDELYPTLSSLFVQYCKPLRDLGAVPSEDMKRRLYSNLQPHLTASLNETFRVVSHSFAEAEQSRQPDQKGIKRCSSANFEKSADLDFHLSISAKYLLISAFLASRNPATLDASLFDSTGGSDGRKRRKKVSEKSKAQQEAAEDELLTKGPGSFPLERLLAIYQCLIPIGEDLADELEESELVEGGLGGGASGNMMLTSNVLLQLSSLCNANFLMRGGSCPLEGSTRYRSMVSEDLALKVARSLKFPLAKYMYSR